MNIMYMYMYIVHVHVYVQYLSMYNFLIVVYICGHVHYVHACMRRATHREEHYTHNQRLFRVHKVHVHVMTHLLAATATAVVR